MSNVLVCIKRVPDSSGQVTLTDDAQGVDGKYAGFTISSHEEAAVELAIQIATATEGQSTVMTLGSADAVEQIRNALALGVSHGVHMEAEPSSFGPADVAREIAAVVGAQSAAGNPIDLILLGNDAADSGDFQVGIRLAYELGWPVVNGQSLVSIADGMITTKGGGPDGQETYEVPCPAVVSVLEGGVEPRYPTVSGRMKARKIEIAMLTLTGTPEGARRVRLTLPPPAPSHTVSLGKGPDSAAAVVDLFDQLGVSR